MTGLRPFHAAARRGDGRPVMLVCSAGGHLLELLELRDAWDAFDRVWVTFDKADTRSLLAAERVRHAFGPTNRSLKNLARNVGLAVRVLAEERPSVILTTGAGLAVPFAWVGWLRGIPTVYVESVTRVDGLSLSGRMIAPVATRLYGQWPELTDPSAGRIHFAGNVLANR